MAKNKDKEPKQNKDDIKQETMEEEEPLEEVSDTQEAPQDDELQALAKERDLYMEMLKRERADFENYKKRNATLSSTSFMNGCADTVEKILPVLDNFERAMAGTEDSDDSFIVGIKMIYRQMQDTLSALGLSEIEAIGKPFDPELMNAVMQAECEEGEESGAVKEVLQKGYMLNDRILRHAMVKVNK